MAGKAGTPAIAMILASGTGARFRSETPKQFLKLAGRSVLEHTLHVFEHHARIDEVIVIVAPEHRDLVGELVKQCGFRKVTKIVDGGASRQASSASGIAAIADDQAMVLVHDAVRPLLNHATIDRCLDALETFDAVDTGIPSPDTIIRVDQHGCIDEIPDRAALRMGQTPQGFRAGLLRKAHALAAADAELKVTDDCGLILHYQLAAVRVVEGDVSNIKITYPSDIYLADRLFQLRTRPFSSDSMVRFLEGKILVVFGASRGIGMRVAALARDAGAIVATASRTDGVDVADSAAVGRVLDAVLAQHGRIDGIINTAGILRTGLLAGQDDKVVEEQIRTNLLGSIVVARESFERIRTSGGSIALFASSSYTRGRAFSAVYSATKAAVVNLMQGLAQEYLPFGVRINVINPERTATPMRTENFGNEPVVELLDADTVAHATLATLLSDCTGEVVDVRR